MNRWNALDLATVDQGMDPTVTVTHAPVDTVTVSRPRFIMDGLCVVIVHLETTWPSDPGIRLGSSCHGTAFVGTEGAVILSGTWPARVSGEILDDLVFAAEMTRRSEPS